MRKIFNLLICSLLISCGISGDDASSFVEETSLDDYPNNFIKWESLFDCGYSNYYVYVFSYDCYYCKEIKPNIVSFYNALEDPLFFVEFNDLIPISNDIDKTIGKNNIEGVFIKGTPTLLCIFEGTVLNNVAGKKNVLAMVDLIINK